MKLSLLTTTTELTIPAKVQAAKSTLNATYNAHTHDRDLLSYKTRRTGYTCVHISPNRTEWNSVHTQKYKTKRTPSVAIHNGDDRVLNITQAAFAYDLIHYVDSEIHNTLCSKKKKTHLKA